MMYDFDDTVLTDFQEDIVMLDETTAPDGFGGFKPVWADGAQITLPIFDPNDISVKIADAITNKQSITILSSENVKLKEGKFFRRLSNGKNYRIDKDNTNRLTPKDSPLRWYFTTATEAALPTSYD